MKTLSAKEARRWCQTQGVSLDKDGFPTSKITKSFDIPSDAGQRVEDHTLITEGPYRLVRHPMYSGFFLFAIGMPLLSANWIVGLPYLAAITYMYLTRVSDEEQMVLEQFGESYRTYMEQTGRLIPKL